MITLGVDIGSLTGKVVILKDGEIAAWHLIPTGPDSVETGSRVCAAAPAANVRSGPSPTVPVTVIVWPVRTARLYPTIGSHGDPVLA